MQKLYTFACDPPLTYAVRIVPVGAFPTRGGWKDESPKLNIDFGVAQAADNIMPGVNLKARHPWNCYLESKI